MQDRELHGRGREHNERLISDLAVIRRQSRSLYRNWIALYKKSACSHSQSSVLGRISSSSIEYNRESSNSLIEDRADEIVRHVEQSLNLMEENPKSNNDRIETLRNMTEFLTVKRSVKRKLIKSIGSNNKTLSFSKRLKYTISIFFYKIPASIKNFLTTFELWYSSLKVIEGHFGSSVASYFKFLRKLFLLNACIFILIFFFIMVPQLIFRFIQYVDVLPRHANETIQDDNYDYFETKFLEGEAKVLPYIKLKSDPYGENEEFRLGNLFTGEGFLTNTILYYGYYTNTSIKLIENYSYNIPASYFFTSIVSYIIIFLFLFISVAVSYRKCYIEASGGINNTFSNKIFCGWDFGIATKQAAELKSKSICIEVKEMINDLSKSKRKKTCASTFYTTAINFSLNALFLIFLVLGGMYSWKYLDQQMAKADTATTMMMWLILTIVVAMAPVLFSLITLFEGYESRSSALYMTLIRSFTLYAVVIAVIVAYRLNRTAESECWETILGQDMYRLVVLDFLFGLIGTAMTEFIRFRIYTTMWRGIGCPEFDIARSTMNLIYNQTLFYIGLYFSPLLSLIITIKMFLTFYIKKWGAIYNCKPFAKPWKASHAHTVYLSIAFFAFFIVVIFYGYIITSVKTSNCGPFRGEKFMYESILDEILVNKDSFILTVLYYITRPGVVGIVLMALLLGVYYMRAVAMARIHVVNYLRQLLLLKAEDRKLLMNKMSEYSKNQPFRNSERPSLSGEGQDDVKYFKVNASLSKELPKMTNTRDSSFCGDLLKQSKNVSSSLINLPQDEREPKFRNSSIFNSIQNIFGNLTKEPQMRPGYYLGSINDVEMNRLSGKEEFSDDLIDKSQQHASSDIESGCNNDVEFGANRSLNFNPIFTESSPHQQEEEESLHDSHFLEQTPKRITMLVSQKQKGFVPQEEFFDEEPTRFYSKNQFSVEDRMPSRISFDANGGSKISKKKKKT